MAQYQFTMFSDKHKPVACIVEAESRVEFAQGKKPFKDAIQKICAQRRWTPIDLKRFGYTKYKVRKVEQENDGKDI